MPDADLTTEEPRRGRPRDPKRDEAIIDAAIELLVRDGYDRLSMESVASEAGVGKATLYRRWSSKAELVIDAMSTLKAGGPVDTGSLDGDLDQLMAASCSPGTQRLQQVMMSICSALPREPELLEAFKTRFTEPRIRRIAGVLERARDRGDISSDVDLAMAASLLPSLMLQRSLMTGRPAGHAYAQQVVGTVLLPVLGRPPRTFSSSSTPSTATPSTKDHS